jgi:hypothetical protein
LALENDETEVEKRFEESLNSDLPEGIESTFDHFLGTDDSEANLLAIVNIRGRIGSSTGKRLFLPGLFFESRAKHPFIAQDKRTTPIDVHYPETESDDVLYHLPPGFSVESAPESSDVTWKGFAVLRINSTVKDNSLEVKRGFARSITLLGPEAYNDLHDFYLKLAAADQQQIVLARAAAAKGN